jgi:hypothetical protein
MDSVTSAPTLNPPLTNDNTRLVFLSVARYPERQKRFRQSLLANGGFLNNLTLEYWEGTPLEQRVAPPSFSQIRGQRHWWAASCDHMDIMESALLDDKEYTIILEDDAHFSADFDTRFAAAWNALPEKWRALRLMWSSGHGNGEVVTEGALHRCDTKSFSMSAIVWNKEGLLRAYDHFWHRRHLVIDVAFADLRSREPGGWYQPPVPIVNNDPLAKQRGGDC